MNDGPQEQICTEVVLPKSTLVKKKDDEKPGVSYAKAISHKGNQFCLNSFLIKYLNITIILPVISSVPKIMTVTAPTCHPIFIFLIHKNEKNKNSLWPLLNQISGIQYFHFISPRSPHIHIIPSSHTTQSHYLYSTCLGKNIGDRSK